MGYYSEVAIQCNKSFSKKLKPLLDKYWKPGEYRLVTNLDDGTEVYHWSCVKWYHRFPEVSSIMKLVEDTTADHSGKEIVACVIVGEDGYTEEYRNDDYDYPLEACTTISY